MKTKEITVWVDPDEVVNDAWTLCHADFYKGELTGMVKARLIIEVPEKKISISESEFEKAFDYIRPKNSDWLMTFEGFEIAKSKLFGKVK